MESPAVSSEPLTWSFILKNRSTAPIDLKICNWDSWTDLPFMIIGAVVIYTVRRLLTKWIYKPIARHFKLEKPSEIQRFCENAWFTTYYLSVTVFGVCVLSRTKWFWDHDYFYRGFPEAHLGYQGFGFRPYFLTGGAFYLQALFTLLFVDERMKDFLEMTVHHIATIILISFSLCSNYHRYGSMILLLHDVVDIFLYSAKMLHAVRTQKILSISCQLIANTCFFMFTISFAVLRLMYFPYLLSFPFRNKYEQTFDSMHYLFRYVPNTHYLFDASHYGVCINRYCVSSYWLLTGLLFVLLFLHFYWFYLTLIVLFKAFKEGNESMHDIREQKEHEEPEESLNRSQCIDSTVEDKKTK
jgi:hypothetical protein